MDKNKHFIIRRASHSMKPNSYDLGKAWEKVKSRSVNRSKRFRVRGLLKYAACVLLVIAGITIYVRYNTADQGGIHISSARPEAGESPAQVTLTLANGEQIQLEKQQEVIKIEELGMSFTRDSTNGQMQYQNYADTLHEETEIKYNKLYIPKGADFYLKLSDGSIVNINSESTLRFPVHFSAHRREVYLEGEAFFQVAKDANAPFTVHAGGKEITVLGTRFNVSAYDNDDEWIATLVDGKVVVSDTEQINTLHPSEQLTIHKATGKTEIKIVDTGLYTSWIDGKFYFKGYRFEDIVKKLERWYDFNMIYRDEEIKEMTFRGTIDKHQSLEQLLRYLEETTNIHFSIDDKTVTVRKTT